MFIDVLNLILQEKPAGEASTKKPAGEVSAEKPVGEVSAEKPAGEVSADRQGSATGDTKMKPREKIISKCLQFLKFLTR